MKKLLSMMLALALVFAVVPVDVAQAVNSTVQTVSLTMAVNETLTLTATPASISFTYAPGSNTATASGAITTTATWNLAGTRTNVKQYAWLSSASAALTNGTTNIPAADIFTTDGNPAVACSATLAGGPGVAGAYCPFWNGNALSWSLGGSGAPYLNTTGQTETYTLSMAGLPALSAGTYSGTLNFEAIAS